MGYRRRLLRALDVLTVRVARGIAPGCARWLLSTALVFLRKESDECAGDEDLEWLWHLDDENTTTDDDVRLGATEPVVEPSVLEVSPRGSDDTQDMAVDGDDGTGGDTAAPARPPVRPIQMGELLRKIVSRRILGAAKGSVDAAVLGARQWGGGAPGGAEGTVHSHLALERMHFRGELPQALAVVQVDAVNCFGLLEWSEIRA